MKRELDPPNESGESPRARHITSGHSCSNVWKGELVRRAQRARHETSVIWARETKC